MRPIAAVFLLLYAAVVARLTLADPSAGEPLFSRLYALPISTSQAEALANVALFVPASFLLAIVLRRPLVAAVLCLAVSVGIEVVQQRYLPGRVPDVADIEHNGLGALIGAVLAGAVLTGQSLFARSRSGPAPAGRVTSLARLVE